MDTAIKETSDTLRKVGGKVSEASGIGYGTQQQAALTGAAEYIKSLAELAKNLSGLTPAVAAFIIATILFFFAAALGVADHVVR